MHLLRRIFLGIALAVSVVFACVAQEDQDQNLVRWEALAARAETTIDSGDATDAALEGLRQRIAIYRDAFEEGQDLNADRIATLKDQISALGAPPEGDDAPPEEPGITKKRTDLSDQLAALQAPVQQAQVAYLRADGLINQIDEMLRDRQNRQLLEVGPSPLNPAYWRPALDDLIKGADAIWEESGLEQNGGDMSSLRRAAPVVVLLAVLGGMLILRGQQWSNAILKRLRRIGARGTGIWRFIVSLLRILLPFAGVVSLVSAALTTGVFGQKGTELLFGLAFVSAVMLGFSWVAERVFPHDDDDPILLLPPEKRADMRFYFTILTITLILAQLVHLVLQAGVPAAASESVLIFPINLVSAFALYRMGLLMQGYLRDHDHSDNAEKHRNSNVCYIIRGLGKGAIGVAIAAPLLMAFGYFKAGDALLVPYILTIVLYWLVLALQRFFTDVYGVLSKQGLQAREGLSSVFFGFVLTLLALPVLALIWGARLTDLTELWASFVRGFTIGDTRISPTDFVYFAVVFGMGYSATRLVQSSLRNNILPKTKIDIGGQTAIVSGVGYVGIFLSALIAITSAGIDLSSLALVAGALSVGIGFGLQNIVSNFVSGIILLIERPISEGDWIEISNGQMGYVRDISVRSTRIETFDRADVIVPNADLVSGVVKNYTRGNTVGRIVVPVRVAFGTDTKKVDDILLKIADAQPLVLQSPAPAVVLMRFGQDALEFEIRCFLRDVNWGMSVRNDINHAIATRFAEEGINVPYAQRDLWLRNPEDLIQTPDPKGKGVKS